MEKTTFEQELERKGNITYTCQGFSMLPLLRQQRDLFTITKKQDRCRKYDVALYKRADGAYVLHRIIQVLPDGYVFLGDNCLNKEYDIREEAVLGPGWKGICGRWAKLSVLRPGLVYAVSAQKVVEVF